MCCLQELLPAPADAVAEVVVPPSFLQSRKLASSMEWQNMQNKEVSVWYLLFASCAEASRVACLGRTWVHSVAVAAAVGAAGLVEEEEEEEEQDGDQVRLVGEVSA